MDLYTLYFFHGGTCWVLVVIDCIEMHQCVCGCMCWLINAFTFVPQPFLGHPGFPGFLGLNCDVPCPSPWPLRLEHS